jgi:broad specificity phosphatase PhoE
VEGGDIAILDGTNTRSSRRRAIEQQLKEHMDRQFKLIWIESICTLEEVIEKNILKTKVTSPDYKNWQDSEKAADDFRNRIKEYEKIYESLSKTRDGEEASFIQIINQGTQIVMRNVRGYIESKILSYLINLHTGDRPIYFTRHGESEYNKRGLIGGDSCLSKMGSKYAERLGDFFKKESIGWKEFRERPLIYCSTMKRAIQTAELLSFINTPLVMKSLDEINCGIRDGLTYEEIKENYPNEHQERNKDKLHYRYPRGESYMDVIQRIEPMIYELERRRGPVIIVGHQGMIRCLYGYFACVPIENIPTLDIPIHTVIKFVPEAYGFCEERFAIDPLSGTISKIDSTVIGKYPDQLSYVPK